MTTAGKSTAAMYRTTATSWKRSIIATACDATRPLEITMVICYVLEHINSNM